MTEDRWTAPHWDSAALVVIDLQRDFLSGGLAPIEGTDAVVPAVVELVESFRAAGRPVAHVVRLYRPSGEDVDLVRRSASEEGWRAVAPGSEGAKVAAGVLPPGAEVDDDALLAGEVLELGPREVILAKPRWSAFHRTRLEEWLQAEGADTVVVAGCNLPNCPRATLFDASERDLRAVLVADAVSRSSPERLADLEAIGVRLASLAEVRAALRS